MDQGILGSLARYDELTFKGPLKEGFTLGAIEAAALQDIDSANNKAQKSRIAQLNAEYEERNFKHVVPTCDSDTIWKLEKTLDARLESFRQSEHQHFVSHASYLLIGYAAAGLFYGSNPDELVNDRVCRINLYYRDAKVREQPLIEAIKKLPVQNLSVESFLRSLKQTLQSCHSSVTILFLAACPDNLDKLRSDREQRTIQETLRNSTYSDAYQLYDVKSCKSRDITAALRKHKPSILHFSGHASRDGLAFENEQGEFDVIELEKLASVMKLGAKNGLRTVVLNACSTADQSDCIANIVGCVVSMKDAVDDKACIDFMRVFYHSLAEGQGVDDAYEWGLAESQFLYRPDMIRPHLVKAGIKSKTASEAQRSSNSVLSEEKVDVGSAQSKELVDDPNNDGKTALTEAEVNEYESEEIDDGDDDVSVSETEALRDVSLTSHDNETISISPSEASLASGNSPAAENAPVSRKDQATGSNPRLMESAPKIGVVVSPTKTTGEKSSPSDGAPVISKTASQTNGASSVMNIKPSESEQPGLSMIERLKLRSKVKEDEHGPKDAVPAQKPSASPRPTPNPQAPRQSSSQAGNAPKIRETNSSHPPGATPSTGRSMHSPFHSHPIFDDPFFNDPFLGGSIFNDMMFDGFFGPRRPAPAQARPATNPQSEVPKAQLQPCDICNKPLTMDGGMTCISCTRGKQIACASCAPRLRCLADKHEVRLVKVQAR